MASKNRKRPSLVSVIIPCYNAERWLAEAIQSCLDQIYRPIEIIVIDDGSTDRSLEVIKSFGDKIRWETGPNRGGNVARNRGFALSKGRFVQFLDADDYIVPEKIGLQVACLEASGADVAYGDWRCQRHDPDGTAHLEAIQVSGKQADITEAWLQGWWLTPAAVLHRRKAISRIGGWDESLKAAQDADLMIRLSLAGSHFKYQRGAYAIYRKHGDDRVSSNPIRWRENRYRVLEKALDTLTHSNRLTPTYCHALAISYYRLARHWLNSDREKHDQLISRVLQLKPNIQSTGRALIRQYLSATD